MATSISASSTALLVQIHKGIVSSGSTRLRVVQRTVTALALLPAVLVSQWVQVLREFGGSYVSGALHEVGWQCTTIVILQALSLLARMVALLE